LGFQPAGYFNAFSDPRRRFACHWAEI